MNLKDKHEFAFYSDSVRFIAQNKSHLDIQEIFDEVLVHRLITVLRLQKGDNIILFDSHYHIKCSIVDFDYKKSITIEIYEIEHNQSLSPNITWLLPLLKREAFEEAIYVLTAMGVQDIQPIITQKTHKFGFEKQENRLKRIMIAAAEQSKQFILPNMHPIIPLEFWFSKRIENTVQVFFDVSGVSLKNFIDLVQLEHFNRIIALVGPEGDLTNGEKMALASNNFIFCTLTKTILRSEQAITVALGALRSLL